MIHIIDGKTDRILSVIDESEFWEDKHTKSLKDTLETFDFTTFANKSFSEYLAERNRIIIPDEDGEYIEFIIENTRKFHGANGLFIEVYTNASYIELSKAKVIEPQTTPSWTAKQHVEVALSDTEWSVGIVDFVGSRTITIESYTNPYSYLKQIASEFNLELHFRVETDGNKVTRRYVDLIEHVGGWNGREVEFGKDLIGIERKEDFSNIVTALVGVGPERDDGTRLQVFVEDKDALARWGRNGKHLVDVYEPDSSDSNMTLERLRSLTEAELAKRINSSVEYTGDVVDLEKVPGLEHEKFRLGDTIRIKDTAFTPPLYLEARIHTVERSIKQNGQKTVTLGDYIEYTEEDVFAIYKRLRAEIKKKVSLSQVMEVTYTKTEIDDKDAGVYQDSTYYADAVSEAKKQEAIQIAADDATQKANQAEQNAKQYAEQYTQQYAEQKVPDVIPNVPANFTATGSFKKVILTWDLDTSEIVSHYELHASQTAGFTPSDNTLIWKGKESTFIHEVDVNQTWYYRLRAVNPYGRASDFTQEVSATTAKIASDEILFGAINAQHLADLSVTAQKLADGAVTNDKIADGAVDNQKLAGLSISAEKLRDGIIDDSKLADLAVTAQKLADGSVTTNKIADGAVNTNKIVDDAITNAKIAAGAVGNAELDRSSVNKIQIGTNDIVNGAITSLKIASNAVDSSKLADLAVTAAKLADGSVDNTKLDRTSPNKIQIDTADIKDAAITSAKIANAAVGAAAIASAAIGTAHIADGAITNAKIANLDASKITSGYIDANRIGAKTITTDKLVVADLTNLCVNPIFDSGSNKEWSGVTTVINTTTGVPANAPTTYVGKQSQRDGYCGSYFPVNEGDKFYIEAWCATSNSTQKFGVGLNFQKEDGTNIWVRAFQTTPIGSWTKFSGEVTVPAGFTKARVWTQIEAFSDFGDWYFTKVVVRRKVNSELIVDGAITASKIAANTITAGSAIIADGAITSAKIADGSITSAKIANAAIGTAAIQDGAITNAKIASAAVGTAAIQDGAITNAKIANAAVGTAQIQDAAITSAKIASAAVGNAAIQNGAITNAKIATAAVGTAQIQDAAITNAKIANLAVDNAKIASLHGSKITAGSITADKMNVASLSAISANLGNVVAGTITANTQIDVVTDASIGKRLVLKYSSSRPSEIVFPNQWNEEYWKIYKFPNTEALVIQGRELNLNCSYNSYIFFGNQAETAYKSDYSSDSNYSYDTTGFYTSAKEKGYCGVGGMAAIATSGTVAGVGVNFRMRRFYTPSSVSFSQISATASPHVADITQDGFWLYVIGNGVQGAYRYWRGYYIVS